MNLRGLRRCLFPKSKVQEVGESPADKVRELWHLFSLSVGPSPVVLLTWFCRAWPTNSMPQLWSSGKIGSCQILQNFKRKINTIGILALCLMLMSCSSVEKKLVDPILHKSLTILGDKEQVWFALTREAELAAWWNKGVKLEPYVGGEFYEPWGDGQLATGKVLLVQPMKSIRFTWREKSWSLEQQTVCEFSLEEHGGITILRVKQSGWESFLKSKNQTLEGFGKGWDFILPKLKSYIEKNKKTPKLEK